VNQRELQEKETKINQLTEWTEGQHNRIVELEANERNLSQAKENLQRENQVARETYYHNLQEQKTFFENKVQAQANQLQANEQTIAQLNQQITAQQENITNLQAQNQTSTTTIRTKVDRITQLETYLNQSQQDQQTKQTQINTLNQDKLNLQTQITQLTQANTETTRTLNEQTETITNLNQTLTRQRGVLERLLANREEELAQLEREENND
jgi:chromosome segregation ATPase